MCLWVCRICNLVFTCALASLNLLEKSKDSLRDSRLESLWISLIKQDMDRVNLAISGRFFIQSLAEDVALYAKNHNVSAVLLKLAY